MGGNLELKTQLGEHNYQKQVCGNSGFCPLHRSNTCPMNSNKNGSYYSCWGDKSGFEYDLMPRNTIGPGGSVESLYDISHQGINHSYLKFSQWNAWIEKFQCDYRFGKVSDTNAQGILFPNVDNPWMFTEYIFQGVGDNSSSKIKWDIPPEYVIQPPIYNPNTLKLINGDVSSYLIPKEKYQNEDRSDDYKYKQFRKIESWDALFSDSDKKYHTEKNEGVKLYRAKIPVQSIKWGEHGNVPPHTIDMTAPKNWFNPDESELKLKVIYDAVVGVALRAPKNIVGVVMWVMGIGTHDVYIEKSINYNKKYGARGIQYYSFDYPATVSDINDVKGDVYILDTPKFATFGASKVDIDKDADKKQDEKKHKQDLLHSKEPTLKLMGVPGTQYVYNQGCSYIFSDKGSVHCRYFQGIQDVDAVAKIIKEGDKEKSISYKELCEKNFIIDRCLRGTNTACEFFNQRQSSPIIASYQSPVPTVSQVSFNSSQIGYSVCAAMISVAVGGVGLGAAVGSMMVAGVTDYVCSKLSEIYQSTVNRDQVEISYNARYVLEQSSRNVIELNKKKYNEFGKDVQIIPGTGKFVLEQRSHFPTVMKGDSILYNDISTLSFHRLFASVMHCATQKSCNEIIGPTSKASGFSHSLRAGADGQCRYYNNGLELTTQGGCPYNCVSKRGYQFAKVMLNMENVLQPFVKMYNQANKLFAWNFKAGEFSQQTLGLYKRRWRGSNQWLIFKDFAVCQQTHTIAVFALNCVGVEFGDIDKFILNNEDISDQIGGAAIVASEYAPPGHALFAKIKTEYQEQTVNGIKRTVYSCRQKYFWYCPQTNNAKKLNEYHSAVFQSDKIQSSVRHVGFYDDFGWKDPSNSNASQNSTPENTPSSNLNVLPILRQTIDKNGYWFCKVDEGFILPASNCMMIDNEKKFIGGWHPEYKDYTKIGGEFLQDVAADWERQGQGMGDYVTNAGYKPLPMPINKKGYWIDQSGEYIIDELNIGIGMTVATERERENASNGHGVCISFKKSNTQFDSETGESKQPMTINGAVFSNDPVSLVESYRKQKKPKFSSPDKHSQSYYAPLIVNNIQMLPTNRQAVHCPSCDYYLSEKYLTISKCPWCDTTMKKINGMRNGPGQGGVWGGNASVIKKFFKLYSIGIVDVWDVPGSSIKTDAYFWRHQTYATNAIRRQIYHKLGNVVDKSYKSDGNNPNSQQTGGLPEGTGFFQKYNDNFMSMINYHMPENYLPNINIINNEVQNFINPYTNSGISQQGLKMLSLKQMITLRNKIQPIFAYTNDIGSSDYINQRASYNNRQIVNQPIIWQGRKALVPTQVLAYTDDGVDSYQEYFSGDYVYGQTREFFPSGYTWWNMKGVIGGRKTSNKGGKYHMDDKPVIKEQDSQGNVGLYNAKHGSMQGGSGGMYTVGHQTVAKCAISIHGVLPLNKQIVAAYLISSPSGIDPSRDPVGLTWTGGKPMYHHYHALPETHYEDGQRQHFHGNAGYSDRTFDENGDVVYLSVGVINLLLDFSFSYSIEALRKKTFYSSKFMDQSQYSLYGMYSDKSDENAFIYYDEKFIDIMKNMSAVYDYSFYKNVGTPKKKIYSLNKQDKEVYYGYDESSFTSPYGFFLSQYHSISDDKKKKMFQYLILNNDNDLVVKYPNSQVWKEVVKQDLDNKIKKHTAVIEFGASDGTEQNYVSTTFTQTDSSLYGDLIPKQSQGISGYFDMGWSNTKGYVYNQYNVQSNKKINWDAPVIFQDGAQSVDLNKKFTEEQLGTASRVLDVTNIVKALYENRVDRTFSCKAGAALNDVINWQFYKPKGQMVNEKDSSGKSSSYEKIDDDVKQQNNQEDFGAQGYILNDNFSYPQMDDDLKIPQIDGEGDKYLISKKYSEITITFTKSIFVIDYTNCNYNIKCDGQSGGQKSLSKREYRLSDFRILVGILFGAQKNSYASQTSSATPTPDDAKREEGSVVIITKLSSYSFRVRSVTQIEINDVQNNCYDFFGIKPGTIYALQVARILSSSNDTYSLPSFYQTSLIYGGSNHWKYKMFENKSQNVVIDLARVPLCKQQRSWRNKKTQFDFSNCYCINGNCLCNQDVKQFTAAQYANLKHLFFDKTSGQCPSCNIALSVENMITIPGDGQKTYFYDSMFAPSPFIFTIEFNLDITKGDFSISVRSSQDDDWFTIATGNNGNLKIYNGEGGWIDSQYTNQVKITFDKGKIRGRFIQIEVGYQQTVQYKQLEIPHGIGTSGFETYRGYGFDGYFLNCCTDNDGTRMLSWNFLDMYGVIGEKDTSNIPSLEEFREEIKRVYSLFDTSSSIQTTTDSGDSSSSQMQSPYKTRYGYAVKVATAAKTRNVLGDICYHLGLNRVFPQKDLGQPEFIPNRMKSLCFKFYIKTYVGGISNLKIKGIHYKTEQSESVEGTDSGKKYLTITDPPDEYKILLRQQQYSYELPFRPTKILSVLAGTDDFGGYVLNEVPTLNQYQPTPTSSSSSSSSSENELANNLRWHTRPETISGNDIIFNEQEFKIRKIERGEYHYDPQTNKIYIPQVDQLGNAFLDFQSDLRNSLVSQSHMPICLKIKYWVDNGKSITLPAWADGQGPSYMVEKGAINELVTQLPANGSSGVILNQDGNKVQGVSIPWQVSNNIPATLDIETQSRSQTSQAIYTQFNSGQFRVNFAPSALNSSKKRDSDQSFVDLYGENCTNCLGRCTTELTFTGVPNQILSGYITAKAPKETMRTINVGNGISYTYKQKTGGIASGLIIAKCTPQSFGAGRMTKTYNIPKLIIYAKDIDPFGNSEK